MQEVIMEKYCIAWSSVCFSIEDWKNIVLSIATLAAIPGAIITVFKTLAEKKLQRQSKVHERQLDLLSRLYASLYLVQQYSMAITKSFSFEGEDKKAYPDLLQESWESAQKIFVDSRLFLSEGLAEDIDGFFLKAWEGQVNFRMAEKLNGLPHQVASCAAYYTQATDTVHRDMPKILRGIELEFRRIIQG